MTYGLSFLEQVRRGKEGRALAAGRTLCRPCRGSGVVTPSGSSERVCGRCLGRGYLIARELSTGSWFEEPARRVDRHKDAGGMKTQFEIQAKVKRRKKGVLDEW